MRTRPLRRLAPDFVAALAPTLALTAAALAGAARAGDVTYPQLGTATTVQDTDLIATWRASGPLTKVQASVLEAYLQGKLSPLFLVPANNLSDLASAGTARANLGLGSAALVNTGTTGTAVCQLNFNCTWTGTQAIDGKATVAAATTAGAMLNLAPGAAPTTPIAGDLWDTSTSLFVYLNGASNQIAFTTSNVASATALQTARTIGASGDVGCTATSFNGTANITLPCALAPGAVTGSKIASGAIAGGNIAGSTVSNGNLAVMNGYTIKGNGSTSSTNPQDLNAAQVLGILGMALGGAPGGIGSAVIPTAQGNLIINWGYFSSMGSGGSETANFNTNYSTGAIGIATGSTNACGATASNTQITIHNAASGVQNCYWIAIGS